MLALAQIPIVALRPSFFGTRSVSSQEALECCRNPSFFDPVEVMEAYWEMKNGHRRGNLVEGNDLW